MLPRIIPSVLSVVLLFSFLFFVTAVLLQFIRIDSPDLENEEVFHSAPYDIFIYSAFYYNKSKSLGDSSMVILMTADFEVLEKVKNLELLGINDTSRAMTSAELERVTIHDACKWIAMTATAKIVLNPSLLLVSLGGNHAPIPFEVVSSEPKPVVMCISPLFAAENWHNLLVSLHVYKIFGAHMHLYIRSIVSPMLEILRVYEQEGYATLKPWNRINLLNRDEQDFNPNLNVEFRSQAAAQTDCLLRYKESSEFVAFVDLDDLIIPRVADNYASEFRYLASEHPTVAYFTYSKENTRIKAYKRANVFSIEHVLRNIKHEQQTETGKMIAIPSKINNTWIHWPQKNLKKLAVKPEFNSITHLKHIELLDGLKSKNEEEPKYNPSTGLDNDKPLISNKNIKMIEKDFNRMSWKSSVRRHLRNLPINMTYSKLISDCYKQSYYAFHSANENHGMLCPGPERCDISNHKTRCWISVGEYHSTRDGKLINVHFAENADFALNDGCQV
ncbi:Glycosyltransferase family 92 protein F13G3.3 [Caenorhabditis elegans]|uniref:Glycosyltransferase family 92 protein F13G3.3 n=2 Tax=Caenorhabditis elegans TaxID=6239 RepID=YSNK_CAEEL|nr:Glycosyltransferase family 92 protein F13G3.3 [Caenorhabditis elegans]Q19417.2 RecName: Full=Glycosyltransferase family 92 protein F13G3.3 [Caenorhabditis elegans]CAA95788.2 Glycosyltransferase family 92 protein F13G3.3 [Caenorhabditis elegans]|eukprot:NP_492062.1 Glycosyltransferase family 92 protein F13G3.3 [Caenorhabditis elegans]